MEEDAVTIGVLVGVNVVGIGIGIGIGIELGSGKRDQVVDYVVAIVLDRREERREAIGVGVGKG